MALVVTVWGVSRARAEQLPAKAGDEAAEPVTPEREAAALTFARLHHPELAELLAQLKTMDAARYQAAVQELFKTSEQLARIQARSPDRYAIELDLWKIDSRIRLAVARSTMVDPDELRDEIKQLLLKRNELRIRQLEGERARLLGRVEKLDASIEKLRSSGDATAERELQRLLRSVQAKNSEATASGKGSARKGAVKSAPRTGPVREN